VKRIVEPISPAVELGHQLFAGPGFTDLMLREHFIDAWSRGLWFKLETADRARKMLGS
jgi:hypothetical protein